MFLLMLPRRGVDNTQKEGSPNVLPNVNHTAASITQLMQERLRKAWERTITGVVISYDSNNLTVLFVVKLYSRVIN